MEGDAAGRCSRCGQDRIGPALECGCAAASWPGARFWRLTGGRPMRYEGPAFYDDGASRIVGYYRDRLGRLWLAYGPWSLFREPVEEERVPPPEEGSRPDPAVPGTPDAPPSPPAGRRRYSMWP